MIDPLMDSKTYWADVLDRLSALDDRLQSIERLVGIFEARLGPVYRAVLNLPKVPAKKKKKARRK